MSHLWQTHTHTHTHRICDFKMLKVFIVFHDGNWIALSILIIFGNYILLGARRRPATVSIQWWLKLNHCNYLHMVSAWFGEWWCVYDTFKSKIYTLICFHGHRQMHLVTRLHQYLPYLSHGKGRPNWYWALGQEAETITKMNEIKGKTSATNRTMYRWETCKRLIISFACLALNNKSPIA